MLDETCAINYNDRRMSIERTRRPDGWVVDVIKNSGMSPDTCALYIELSDLPQKFEINQKYVVRTGRYGGEKRVRRMFVEMVAAGKAEISATRDADGKFYPGIYRLKGCGAVDNPSVDCAFKNGEDAYLGGSDDQERRADNRRAVIDNSIDNPDTLNGAAVENSVPSCPTSQAERPQAAAKSHVTGEAEPPRTAAKGGLPSATRENERAKAPAKGSAVKGGGGRGKIAQKSASETDENRYIERHRQQLIDAGGRALANPRTTPGLWRLFEVIAWVAAGYDFERDILPTIRDVSARATLEPGSVVSWRYYTAAIRAAHARRKGLEEPPKRGRYAPRLDPYAPAPRDPDDGTFQQIVLASQIKRQKGGG